MAKEVATTRKKGVSVIRLRPREDCAADGCGGVSRIDQLTINP
jgi:hypothetical protein